MPASQKLLCPSQNIMIRESCAAMAQDRSFATMVPWFFPKEDMTTKRAHHPALAQWSTEGWCPGGGGSNTKVCWRGQHRRDRLSKHRKGHLPPRRGLGIRAQTQVPMTRQGRAQTQHQNCQKSSEGWACPNTQIQKASCLACFGCLSRGHKTRHSPSDSWPSCQRWTPCRWRKRCRCRQSLCR